MSNKPLNPKEIYPDPAQRSEIMFQEQKEVSRKGTITSIVIFLIILLVIVLGIFLIYKYNTIQIAKEAITNQVSDSKVQNDLARVKTVSGYYYRSYKSFEGMDEDMDYKKVAQEISNDGSELHLQGLGEKTFVAYLTLPQSKKLYCTDANGFLGEITTISPTQTTCK